MNGLRIPIASEINDAIQGAVATAVAALNTAIQTAVATALATIPRSTPLQGVSPNATVTGFSVTFPKAYQSTPIVYPIAQWSSTQVVIPSITNVTPTGCTVTVMRSKGTLLLSAGPFEIAPAGTSYLIVPFGVAAP